MFSGLALRACVCSLSCSNLVPFVHVTMLTPLPLLVCLQPASSQPPSRAASRAVGQAARQTSRTRAVRTLTMHSSVSPVDTRYRFTPCVFCIGALEPFSSCRHRPSPPSSSFLPPSPLRTLSLPLHPPSSFPPLPPAVLPSPIPDASVAFITFIPHVVCRWAPRPPPCALRPPPSALPCPSLPSCSQ